MSYPRPIFVKTPPPPKKKKHIDFAKCLVLALHGWL